MASKPYGALYIGSTFDLARRVLEHKTRAVPGFTAKYDVGQLVWYEVHEALETSLIRERQLKKSKRDWKISLIERDNPHLVDLYPSLGPRALKPLGKLSVGARMGPCPRRDP